MPWLLIKAKKTHFFGDKWQECLDSNSAPSPIVKDHDLSCWWIEDNNSNLARVVTALAANCDHIQDTSFVGVALESAHALGIDVADTPGTTPDAHANEVWHRDLVGLSDDCHDPTLIALGQAIHDSPACLGKLSKKQLMKLVSDGLEAGELDANKISPHVLKKVGGRQ